MTGLLSYVALTELFGKPTTFAIRGRSFHIVYPETTADQMSSDLVGRV